MNDNATFLETAYTWMALSRSVEERLRSAYAQGRLRGRFVSGRGQEAIPVGAALALSELDYLAPLHRDLGAHLVRGMTPLTIFRHYLGRATGPSRGRDSDLHIGEWHKRVYPMVSHLPDSWPVIAGAAMACKLRGEPHLALAVCGDGATSTGCWHETVNFAAVQRLPMILLVENNQFAYSTPTSSQYRCDRLVDRAIGYGIEGMEVDGNDVEAVHEVIGKAVATVRSGEGPVLVVAHTLRMEGHAFHDAASYVPAELTAEWAQRDPVDQVVVKLRALGWDDARFAAVHDRHAAELKDAWAQAESESMPDASELELDVYAT